MIRSRASCVSKLVQRRAERTAAYREVNTLNLYSVKLSKLGQELRLSRFPGLVVYVLGLKSDTKYFPVGHEARENVGSPELSSLTFLWHAKKLLNYGLDVYWAVAPCDDRIRTAREPRK